MYILENNSDGLGTIVRVIEGEMTEQEKQDAIKASIMEDMKKQCEQEILEVYPYYKQINLQYEVIEISLKAQYEKRDFTEEELVKINEAKAGIAFIKQKRDTCNLRIQELT